MARVEYRYICMAAKPVYFQPATQQRQARAHQRRITGVVLLCAAAIGALLAAANSAEPVFARELGLCPHARSTADCLLSPQAHAGIGFGAAFAAAVLMSPLIWWAPRRLPAPVHCAACGACGWPEDLHPSAPTCPCCGNSTFHLLETTVRGVPLGEHMLILPRRRWEYNLPGAAILARHPPRRSPASGAVQ